VAGIEELRDDGRTDPAGCSGDEDAHEILQMINGPQAGLMSLDDITVQADVIACHHLD
jgi:hypothetical protein